ncbi:MAG: hypothetical protein ACQESR_03820 [Planctomycetota bacterium]
MSDSNRTNAVRCPECGFVSRDWGGSCACARAQPTHRPAAVLDWDNAGATESVHLPSDGEPRTPVVAREDTLETSAPGQRPAALGSVSSRTETHPQPEPTVHPVPDAMARHGAQVVGRVIAIDSSHREPPDPDLCRVLTKLLWAPLLLVLPLAVVGHALVAFGSLLALAGVAGAMLLLRFLPWTTLLWFAYLAHINRRPDEQVPVWYARVREARDDSEVMVRLKGSFSRGNVAPDDLVSFRGAWREGVLMARFGFNHRTRSEIQFRRSRWWIGLALTLMFAAVLACQLHGTWVALNSIVR